MQDGRRRHRQSTGGWAEPVDSSVGDPTGRCESTPRWADFGELSDALLQLPLGVGGAKMHADQRASADEKMHVGVVEARQQKPAAEIETRVSGPANFRMAAFSPTAMILEPSSATAWAVGSAGFRSTPYH